MNKKIEYIKCLNRPILNLFIHSNQLFFQSVMPMCIVVGILLVPIIGAIFTGIGCDSKFLSSCVTYNIQEYTVVGYHFVNKTCTFCECTQQNIRTNGGKKCDSRCTTDVSYPCYDTYANLSNGGMDDCSAKSGSGSNLTSAMLYTMNRYPIGGIEKIYYSDPICKFSPTFTSSFFAQAGVFLLIFSGVFFGICFCLICYISKNPKKIVYSPEIRNVLSRKHYSI